MRDHDDKPHYGLCQVGGEHRETDLLKLGTKTNKRKDLLFKGAGQSHMEISAEADYLFDSLYENSFL